MLSLIHCRRNLQRSRPARALLLLVALAWIVLSGPRWDVHSHALAPDRLGHHADAQDHAHAPVVADPHLDVDAAADAGEQVSHVHVAPAASADLPAEPGPFRPPLAWRVRLPPPVAVAVARGESTPPHRPPIA